MERKKVAFGELSDAKDKARPEYAGFVAKRRDKIQATAISDWLILTVAGVDIPIMYYFKNASKAVYVDERIPDVRASLNDMWYNNNYTAAKWSYETDIPLVGYNGKATSPADKFKTVYKEHPSMTAAVGYFGGNATCNNYLVSDPAGKFEPVTRDNTQVMIYNIAQLEVMGKNEEKDPADASVFWENKLAWFDWSNHNYYTGETDGLFRFFTQPIKLNSLVTQYGNSSADTPSWLVTTAMNGLINNAEKQFQRTDVTELKLAHTDLAANIAVGPVNSSYSYDESQTLTVVSDGDGKAYKNNQVYNPYYTTQADSNGQPLLLVTATQSPTKEALRWYAVNKFDGKSVQDATPNIVSTADAQGAYYGGDEVGNSGASLGFTLGAGYTNEIFGPNSIIVYDPVSVDHAYLIGAPASRDQRTTPSMLSTWEDDTAARLGCPRVANLCKFAVLACKYWDEETRLLFTFSDTVNSQTSGASEFIESGSGIKVAANTGFSRSGEKLQMQASAIRQAFKLSDFSTTYSISETWTVKFNVTPGSGGERMLVGFNGVGLTVTSNGKLRVRSGNDVYYEANNASIAGLSDVAIAWEVDLYDLALSRVSINGGVSWLPLTKVGTDSSVLPASAFGEYLYVGSWGQNTTYNANVAMTYDNLTLIKNAGSSEHGPECIANTFKHVGGLNAHVHTLDCLGTAGDTKWLQGEINKYNAGTLSAAEFAKEIASDRYVTETGETTFEALMRNSGAEQLLVKYSDFSNSLNEAKPFGATQGVTYGVNLNIPAAVTGEGLWLPLHKDVGTNVTKVRVYYTTSANRQINAGFASGSNTRVWGAEATLRTDKPYVDIAIGTAWDNLGAYGGMVLSFSAMGSGSTTISSVEVYGVGSTSEFKDADGAYDILAGSGAVTRAYTLPAGAYTWYSIDGDGRGGQLVNRAGVTFANYTSYLYPSDFILNTTTTVYVLGGDAAIAGIPEKSEWEAYTSYATSTGFYSINLPAGTYRFSGSGTGVSLIYAGAASGSLNGVPVYAVQLAAANAAVANGSITSAQDYNFTSTYGANVAFTVGSTTQFMIKLGGVTGYTTTASVTALATDSTSYSTMAISVWQTLQASLTEHYAAVLPIFTYGYTYEQGSISLTAAQRQSLSSSGTVVYVPNGLASNVPNSTQACWVDSSDGSNIWLYHGILTTRPGNSTPIYSGGAISIQRLKITPAVPPVPEKSGNVMIRTSDDNGGYYIHATDKRLLTFADVVGLVYADGSPVFPDFPWTVDGVQNPIWKCDNTTPNAHVCIDCDTTLDYSACTEPHHITGYAQMTPAQQATTKASASHHYAYGNEICYDACMDDHKHNPSASVIVGANQADRSSNFISIDWPITAVYPNIADLGGSGSWGILKLSESLGRGWTNNYDVTKWTRAKWITLPASVIYDGSIRQANAWFRLADRGDFTTKTQTSSGNEWGGKQYIDYSVRDWSLYGDKIYDDLYASVYDFYVISSTDELPAGTVAFNSVALNAASSSTNVRDDMQITNLQSKGAFTRLYGAYRSSLFDVVGRIGNFILEDVTDPTFRNVFKNPAQITDTPTYSAVGGGDLIAVGSARTEGLAVIADKAGAGAKAILSDSVLPLGSKVSAGAYTLSIVGEHLDMGGLFISISNTQGNVMDLSSLEQANKLNVLRNDADKVIISLDTEMPSLSDSLTISVSWICADTREVMKVSSIGFVYEKNRGLIDGVAPSVDNNSQNYFLGDNRDIRGLTVNGSVVDKTGAAQNPAYWFEAWYHDAFGDTLDPGERTKQDVGNGSTIWSNRERVWNDSLTQPLADIPYVWNGINRSLYSTFILSTYQAKTWIPNGDPTYTGVKRWDMPLIADMNQIPSLMGTQVNVASSYLWDVETVGNYYSETSRLLAVPFYYELRMGPNYYEQQPDGIFVVKNADDYELIPVDVYMQTAVGFATENLFGATDGTVVSLPGLQEMGAMPIYIRWNEEASGTNNRRNYTEIEDARTKLVTETEELVSTGQMVEYVDPEDGQTYTAEGSKWVPVSFGRASTDKLIGSSQGVLLDKYARTLVGSEFTYGVLKNLANGRSPAGTPWVTPTEPVIEQFDTGYSNTNGAYEREWWIRTVQRWHGTTGLATGSVFVPHGEYPVIDGNVLAMTNRLGINGDLGLKAVGIDDGQIRSQIVFGIMLKAVGDVWSLAAGAGGLADQLVVGYGTLADFAENSRITTGYNLVFSDSPEGRLLSHRMRYVLQRTTRPGGGINILQGQNFSIIPLLGASATLPLTTPQSAEGVEIIKTH
jgi:hypothetical protein